MAKIGFANILSQLSVVWGASAAINRVGWRYSLNLLGEGRGREKGKENGEGDEKGRNVDGKGGERRNLWSAFSFVKRKTLPNILAIKGTGSRKMIFCSPAPAWFIPFL